MAKIKVSASEAMLSGFPAVWPAALRVHSGNVVRERSITHVPGDPGQPFGEGEVAEKFHRVADRVAGAAKIDQLIATTRGVLDGGATLAQLLAEIGHATEK
jgi:2-methylcitrate dehydratase PrpD